MLLVNILLRQYRALLDIKEEVSVSAISVYLLAVGIKYITDKHTSDQSQQFLGPLRTYPGFTLTLRVMDNPASDLNRELAYN